jgi:hypothetical protein
MSDRFWHLLGFSLMVLAVGGALISMALLVFGLL